MLERKHRIRSYLPDLPSQLPQKLQQRPWIAGPARPAINRIRRCIERCRLAKEEQVVDLVTKLGQAGPDEPGDLLGPRILRLGLDEKDPSRLDAHFVLQCMALNRTDPRAGLDRISLLEKRAWVCVWNGERHGLLVGWGGRSLVSQRDRPHTE